MIPSTLQWELSKEVTLHYIITYIVCLFQPIGNVPQSARLTILHTRDTYLKIHFPEHINILWLHLSKQQWKCKAKQHKSKFLFLKKGVWPNIIRCRYKAYFSENIFQLQMIRKQSARIHQSLILCRLGDGTKKGI